MLRYRLEWVRKTLRKMKRNASMVRTLATKRRSEPGGGFGPSSVRRFPSAARSSSENGSGLALGPASAESGDAEDRAFPAPAPSNIFAFGGALMFMCEADVPAAPGESAPTLRLRLADGSPALALLLLPPNTCSSGSTIRSAGMSGSPPIITNGELGVTASSLRLPVLGLIFD